MDLAAEPAATRGPTLAAALALPAPALAPATQAAVRARFGDALAAELLPVLAARKRVLLFSRSIELSPRRLKHGDRAAVIFGPRRLAKKRVVSINHLLDF